MEQQSEPMSLSSVYEAHATKNWSVKFICLGLKINEISYSDIYSTMEQGLADIQMLGLRLNEVRNRSRLDQVFRNVIESFPTVFTGIPEPWQSRCLSAIAQKCNNNRKRRVLDRATTSAQIESVAHRLKLTNTRRPSKEGPELVARNSLVFGMVQTEVVCEGDGREMLCGCRYFTAGSTPDDKITSTDLDFSLFTGVLSEDIGFDPTKYGIFYCNSRGREMEVLTERTWRAAMDEMYTEGLDRFYFTVRYKYQGIPHPATTPTHIETITPQAVISNSSSKLPGTQLESERNRSRPKGLRASVREISGTLRPTVSTYKAELASNKSKRKRETSVQPKKKKPRA